MLVTSCLQNELVKTEDSPNFRLNHTANGWPFDRESIGLPVNRNKMELMTEGNKPPQGACPSRTGTECCGNGRDFF